MIRKILIKLTDSLVLRPTTHPIDTGTRERHVFQVTSAASDMANAEVWKLPCINDDCDKRELLVVKFPGTGGRAEWARPHPFDLLPFVSGEVWALNHRGYGGSDGPATLQNFTETIDALWAEIDQFHSDKKILVYGNSLGCISALYMSMRFPVHGVMLKNGFCLKRLISMRPKYNIWNLGYAKFLAAKVPQELNGIGNAKRSNAPCLFIRSEKDKVIPAVYQMALYTAYSGPKQQFLIKDADHDEPVGQSQIEEYRESVNWLAERMGLTSSD